MRKLSRVFWVALALVFLLEAWLWDHLQPIVAQVVDLVPWKRLKTRIAAFVRTLSPLATLAVFIVPVIVLLPLKFGEIWLLSHRRWFAALALLVFAKLLGLGVTAFIFDITRRKLLLIPWFRRTYDTVMWWRDWAHAMVDPVERRLKQLMRVFGPGRTSRSVRLLWRIRRRMHAHAALYPLLPRVYDTVMRGYDQVRATVHPIQQRSRQWLRVFGPGRTGRAVRLLWRMRRRMHAHVVL
jgi:hypothetical protein